MKCTNCQFENPPGFAFCGKCGTPLAASPPADTLSDAELNHLATYLPPSLAESLRLNALALPPQLLTETIHHLSELLQTTVTHFPTYLVSQIVRHPSPGEAGGEFIPGTLLFADISGFTAMSERLSRIGQEGAEEITEIVNRHFNVMLAILRAYQGELIKFGGDALLSLFHEPDSVTRAAQAAVDMQAAMAEFSEVKTSQGVFPLRMKIGLRRGRFFAARLGTADGMEYALFGSDVNATAATESAAVAGQILLNRDALHAITVPCRASPLDGNDNHVNLEQIERASASASPSAFATFHLPPLSDMEPTLQTVRQAVELLDAFVPYLPAGLLARLASDPRATSLEGEHRLVAVLFANILGLSQVVEGLGPGREPDITRVINRYFTTMTDNLRQFGGVVNKIDLYDHGDKLLAFFGAPMAHEDDPERVVRAALAMQESLSNLGRSLPAEVGLPDVTLRQKVGISYGYVFAGYVGASWRHEYTVMGDEVNLAARLMSVSQPGEVIVSSDVRRKVQALFEFESQGEVRLKGKSAPVPIFCVRGERAIPESQRGLRGMTSPLVGRQREWDALTAAVQNLCDGRGQVATIVGESGLGKSRLVLELRNHLQTDNPSPVRWVESRCLSFTETVSYRLFQDLLRELCAIALNASVAESWHQLRQTATRLLSPEAIPETLPFLAQFLNLPLDEAMAQKLRYLDAEALQRRTFVAFQTLLTTSARQRPLLIVLDDLHWIDHASLELLKYLLSLVNHAPVMFILLYRPEKTKPCWQIHEKVIREFEHCATNLALRRLRPGDSQTMLTNLLSLEEWSDQIRALILDRAEGNPLFLEEVLRTLINSGALVQNRRGRWELRGNLETVAVPDTLQGVIMARLDRLREPCRWTAQIASVAGRIFPFDLLDSTISPKESDQINQCMVDLQRYEIIEESQRTPELIYAFRHTIAQEAIYHSLLARVRHRYHRKIAAYLERNRSVGRWEAENALPLIAHHAYAGQDWEKALRYQILAGQQAQKLFANADAIGHFQKALYCTDHLPAAKTVAERQTIHAALGELLATTGQYDDALAHLLAAYALAQEQGNRNSQARACRWLARVYEYRGEYPPAFEWIERGLGILAGDETAETAELFLLSGFIHTRQGDYEQALAQCEKSLTLSEKLNEMVVMARSYDLLGLITRLRGNSAQAITYSQRAFDLFELAGDLNSQAKTHMNLANAHFDLGQWAEADHHYHQAHKIFYQLGDVYYCAVIDNNLGGIALNQGRLEEALNFYREGLQSLEKIGASAYVLGVFHMNIGAALIRKGDIEAARQQLKTSRKYYEQAQSRDFLPELYRHMAEAALHLRNLPEAETYGQKSLALARELAMRAEEGKTLRVLGKIAVLQEQVPQAEEAFRQSLAILTEGSETYEAACTRLCIARLYARQNKTKAALEAVKACIAVFQKLEAALDLQAAKDLHQQLTSGNN